MLNIFETEAQLEGSLKGREKERTERESSRGGGQASEMAS